MRRITLNIPDDTYHRALRLARLAGRDVSEVITETLALSLGPVASERGVYAPVEKLSDREILQLAEASMPKKQDKRFGLLLEKQAAGTLERDEREELLTLFKLYQEGLLRKASAMSEAKRRGLLEG